MSKIVCETGLAVKGKVAASGGGGRADTLVMKLLSMIYTVYLPLLQR